MLDKQAQFVSIEYGIYKLELMNKISINDFTNLKEIGHGAFGTVYSATYVKSKRNLALKKMSKAHLEKQNMITQINTEINISTNLKHDNIIRVFDCFQDDQSIYLVLQLAENGQLYEKLKKVGRFEQKQVKKMVTQVIAAVQYLHSRSPPIVHRDIKPENLLLDKNDRIKLADFGWSTILNKPRKTYCGTIDYLAPQMIDKSGHDEKLDIWCIGVLVFELLTGKTPFLGKNEADTSGAKNQKILYDNILNVRISFPEHFPILAKEFIQGLIKRNPKERMTFPQIKQHPWLKQVEVDNQINFMKQPESSQRINTEQRGEKVKKNQEPSGENQIIRELNKKIRQLEEENLQYKMKLDQQEKKLKLNGKSEAAEKNEVSNLVIEVRRLKVLEEMNEKYKKKEQEMWQKINEKEKQLIRIKSELKRVEDLKSEVSRLESDRQKFQQKNKKLQKELLQLQERNRQLQLKLNQSNSGFEQRVKKGKKIQKQQIESPQFLTYLRDQISLLNFKFEQSRQVVSKMFEKQGKEKSLMQDYARLKAEEKKMKQMIRVELKQKFQNEKDDLLQKVRRELMEQRQKWFKQREQLKSIYEEGNGGNNQNQSTKNSKQQDMIAQLNNIRELNAYYEKRCNNQMHEIEDLKQQLKRKK